MDAPRQRYRVIERNRRLEVIDTLAGGPPRTPRPTAGRTRNPMAGATWLDAACYRIALALCRGRTDSTGWPVIATSAYFDLDGPREVVLDEDGVHKLARWAMGTAGGTFVSIIPLVFEPRLIVLHLVALAVATLVPSTKRKEAVADWLNELGATLPVTSP
jgi:hypothetical protein